MLGVKEGGERELGEREREMGDRSREGGGRVTLAIQG